MAAAAVELGMPVTRERLLHLLAEASELEHNLLCSYLFALFSLKRRADEDLRPAELAAVGRWRRLLLDICVEEMEHLTQVANLTSALGVMPHFNRPNLPVAPGYHPARIVVGLTPFNAETLKHFIFLERPDCVDCDDSDRFMADDEDAGVSRGGASRLIPSAPEYDTIGEFYGVLRRELQAFAAREGNELFCTDGFQLDGAAIDSDSVRVIRSLADAEAAIDRIVEQGEGAPRQGEESHFARFTAMLDELAALQRERPAFRPAFRSARRVGVNPVMRSPQAAERTPVTWAGGLACLDAFNAVYWMMLRTLTTLYASRPPHNAAPRLTRHLLQCMHLLAELADPLTQQPANDDSPQLMAGPSFTMYRHAEPAADLAHGVRHLRERCGEIADQLRALPIDAALAERLVKRLRAMGVALGPSSGDGG